MATSLSVRTSERPRDFLSDHQNVVVQERILAILAERAAIGRQRHRRLAGLGAEYARRVKVGRIVVRIMYHLARGERGFREASGSVPDDPEVAYDVIGIVPVQRRVGFFHAHGSFEPKRQQSQREDEQEREKPRAG